MKKSKYTVKKIVGILKDPFPQFVSLVGHGANQTPFAVVKVANVPTQEEETMKNKATKKATDGTELAKKIVLVDRFKFSSNHFADEVAVREYMDERQYSDYEVSQTDEGFEVIASEGETFSETKEVKAEKGVTVVIGANEVEEQGEEPGAEDSQKALSPESEGAPAAASAPSDSPSEEENSDEVPTPDYVQKFDDFMASYSTAANFDEVLKAGADGIPPGFFDIAQAMVTATRNALLDQNHKAVKGIMTSFGEAVVRLADALSSATVPGEIVEKLLAMPEGFENQEEKPVEIEETPGADKVETQKEEATEEGTTEGQEGGLLEKLDSLLALSEKQDVAATAIQKTVEASATTVKELSETVESLTERVGVIENTASSRKGMDMEQEEEKKKTGGISKTTRNALGMRSETPAE